MHDGFCRVRRAILLFLVFVHTPTHHMNTPADDADDVAVALAV